MCLNFRRLDTSFRQAFTVEQIPPMLKTSRNTLGLDRLALPEHRHVEPCGASLAAETLAARFRMIGEDLLAGLRFASMQTVRPQFGDEIGKRARDNGLDMLHGLQMRRRHESDTKGLAIRNGSRDPWPMHELVIEIEGEVI